jgi:hypothetical protein
MVVVAAIMASYAFELHCISIDTKKATKSDGTSQRLDILVAHLNERPAQSQGLGSSTAAFDHLMRMPTVAQKEIRESALAH